jgi:leader peptidase (prepilin peptidase)/N-methyltransferase
VFSYLVLRGRCSACGSFIPYRYALVELLTASAFVLAYLKAGDWLELGLLLALLSLLIVGLVYDFYHMIIPDEVSYGAAALALALVSWQTYQYGDWQILINAVLGATISFFIFAGLWYFSKGKAFGFGDAKLVISLGAITGLSAIFSFIVFSFWIGAAVSLVIIAFQRTILNKTYGFTAWRRVNIKSEVPFAPFMAASFVLVYFFNVDILNFIENITQWLG